jgi:GTP diphosphokinase / guanosine-3',5'-bis(diphosphate) 3'-diphosphatase
MLRLVAVTSASGRVVNKIAEIEEDELDDELELELDLLKHRQRSCLMMRSGSWALRVLPQPWANAVTPCQVMILSGILPGEEGQPFTAKIARTFCVSQKKNVWLKYLGVSQVKPFTVPIQIKAYDRQGLMSDISNVISDESVSLIDMNMKMNQHLAEIRLVIGVRDHPTQ